MTTTIRHRIKEFIKDNDITFKVGKRNTDSVILSGYTQYLGLKRKDLTDLISTIEENCPERDPNCVEEFIRVFNYAEKNNYKKFWEEESNKKLYKY